jgi:ABC-type multidrug transport system fused ATPase/permease subunit
MMSTFLFDLNTATEEDLSNLPGMTLEIIERIQKSRPFASVEELKKIKGVNQKLFKKWQPSLYVNGRQEEERTPDESVESAKAADTDSFAKLQPSVSENGELSDSVPAEQDMELEESAASIAQITDSGAATSSGGVSPGRIFTGAAVEGSIFEKPLPEGDVPDQVVEEPKANNVIRDKEPETTPPSALPTAYFSRWQTVLLVFFSIGVSFTLAVASVLVVLLILNGGLLYAPTNITNRMGNQIDGLSNQMVTMQNNLQSVDGRMQVIDEKLKVVEAQLSAMDEIAAQVTDLQNQVDQARSDVRAARALTESLSSDVDALSENVNGLETRMLTFERFLSGLHRLLESASEP